MRNEAEHAQSAVRRNKAYVQLCRTSPKCNEAEQAQSAMTREDVLRPLTLPYFLDPLYKINDIVVVLTLNVIATGPAAVVSRCQLSARLQPLESFSSSFCCCCCCCCEAQHCGDFIPKAGIAS